VRLAGEPVALTRTEFRLLCVLAEQAGRVLSRGQLLNQVWQYDFGDERLVDVHIGRLRRKIEVDPAAPEHLVTVRGLGYKLT
jgi:DNA-binding response OmpR family regulator